MAIWALVCVKCTFLKLCMYNVHVCTCVYAECMMFWKVNRKVYCQSEILKRSDWIQINISNCALYLIYENRYYLENAWN